MERETYTKIINKHKPKEEIVRNGITSFLVGGLLGVVGQGLIDFYSYVFNISSSSASIIMIITLIFISSLFTSIGFFDSLVHKARCGLIIPITGFAHAMSSTALEYRKEGLVNGIGSNMFKLAGSVIIYGVVSAYTFGLIRILLLGV